MLSIVNLDDYDVLVNDGHVIAEIYEKPAGFLKDYETLVKLVSHSDDFYAVFDQFRCRKANIQKILEIHSDRIEKHENIPVVTRLLKGLSDLGYTSDVDYVEAYKHIKGNIVRMELLYDGFYIDYGDGSLAFGNDDETHTVNVRFQQGDGIENIIEQHNTRKVVDRILKMAQEWKQAKENEVVATFAP